MIKKTIIFMALIFFVGCSSMIGKNKLSKGIESYKIYGPSEKSILDLGQGLDYFQDSPTGIETFKAQHIQLVILKENILAKKIYNSNDLKNLRLYLLSSNFVNHLAPKIPNLNIDTRTLASDRRLITEIFEKNILNDKTEHLSRANKISKIRYYKKVLNVINSSSISNKVRNLEQDVTINIYVTTSSRNFYNYRNYRNSINLEYFIINSTEKRIGSNLGNYIFLRGYSRGLFTLPKNSYLINIDISDIDIRKIDLKEEKAFGDENKTIVTQKNSLSVKGGYEFLSFNGYKNIQYRPFNYNRNYEVKTIFDKNSIQYGNENQIIENILKDIFNDVVYKLNFIGYSL